MFIPEHKISVWLSGAKPVSSGEVYRNRIGKTPGYRKAEQVGRTGQRSSPKLEDKDELSKVALNEGLTIKRRMTMKEAGGRQHP
jgi:hypothetical protein